MVPPFRARSPWWGPDLQTLRNTLRRPEPDLARYRSERLKLPLGDESGDVLSVLLQHPETRERGEVVGAGLVVLIHGLGGSEESPYMKVSAAHWLGRGHPVLRLNLRGAGPSRSLCRFQYHAGRSADLHAALGQLPPALLARGLFLVGYSLGGNMLLKFLAEYGDAHPIRGAASVSAPIDLGAASRRFLDRRNAFYHWHLLRGLKAESLASGSAVSGEEAARIRAARSVYEFDDVFVAPRNAFAGAPDYYARCSARGFLGEIRVATAVIHALDDPWIPADAYRAQRWSATPSLTPMLSASGGHVGFHARGSRTPWHDRVLVEFFAAR